MEKENNEFKSVNIIKKANLYFNGAVSSRTILFEDGTKKTLGIMQPGEYEFSTLEPELMDIYTGRLEVLLPGSDSWKEVQGGGSFEVAGNASFRVRVSELTDYCCSFLK